ncbi:MAG TPA: PLDc N-terminal domain-containing protein [Allosphingosinicella sp.]|nr:PLDc N-terminal domain-containing protein [Allosphingosinicella sp.]
MPILFAIIALQIACAVHCVKSGRSGTWVMVIVFFPVIGSLAYVVMEVLPGSGVPQQVGKARAKAAAKLDPDKPIRLAREALETADTAATRVRLADALADRALWDEAIQHYEQGELKAPGGSDRGIRLKLIRALFEAGRTKRARDMLEGLEPSSLRSDNDRASLLLARMLEAEGEHERALALYAEVGIRLPGAEAQCREAGLLLSLGRRSEAMVPLAEAERRAKRMEKSERAKDGEMYAWAAETLAELRAEGLG